MSVSAKVEMYVMKGCPYCLRAKTLLNKKGAEIEEYPAANDAKRKQEMIERSNGKVSFPQIFINEQHIGGCDDLYALEEKGELDALLQ